MKKTKLYYRIPYADTDKMGVVYYANYLVYFERMRNELLRDLGYSYVDMEKDGYALPVIEANCVYLKPAIYDDLIAIHGWGEIISMIRIKIYCEIFKDKIKLANGYTIHACLSTKNRKPARIPQKFADKLFL